MIVGNYDLNEIKIAFLGAMKLEYYIRLAVIGSEMRVAAEIHITNMVAVFTYHLSTDTHQTEANERVMIIQELIFSHVSYRQLISRILPMCNQHVTPYKLRLARYYTLHTLPQ